MDARILKVRPPLQVRQPRALIPNRKGNCLRWAGQPDRAAGLSQSAADVYKPVIVLVEPIVGENIGAAARAMKNFGLSELRLVKPKDGWPNPAADTLAVGAVDLLRAAKLYDRLEDALADMEFVYATTARPRGMGKQAVLSKDLTHDVPPGLRTAIVFGRENSGLTNQEVAMSNRIVTVDSSPDYPVLNLAQSVVLVCHELYQWRKQQIAKIAISSSANQPYPVPTSDPDTSRQPSNMAKTTLSSSRNLTTTASTSDPAISTQPAQLVEMATSPSVFTASPITSDPRTSLQPPDSDSAHATVVPRLGGVPLHEGPSTPAVSEGSDPVSSPSLHGITHPAPSQEMGRHGTLQTATPSDTGSDADSATHVPDKVAAQNDDGSVLGSSVDATWAVWQKSQPGVMDATADSVGRSCGNNANGEVDNYCITVHSSGGATEEADVNNTFVGTGDGSESGSTNEEVDKYNITIDSRSLRPSSLRVEGEGCETATTLPDISSLESMDVVAVGVSSRDGGYTASVEGCEPAVKPTGISLLDGAVSPTDRSPGSTPTPMYTQPDGSGAASDLDLSNGRPVVPAGGRFAQQLESQRLLQTLAAASGNSAGAVSPTVTAPGVPPRKQLASHAETEAFYGRLFKRLDEVGFFENSNRDRITHVVRNIFGRVPQLTKLELNVLQGIVSKLPKARD